MLLRGEAYFAEHQGLAAAAEFQKILDHRGVVISDPIGVLAHWQQGRALALSGDKGKAKTAYEEFFKLWKTQTPALQSSSEPALNMWTSTGDPIANA